MIPDSAKPDCRTKVSFLFSRSVGRGSKYSRRLSSKFSCPLKGMGSIESLIAHLGQGKVDGKPEHSVVSGSKIYTKNALTAVYL